MFMLVYLGFAVGILVRLVHAGVRPTKEQAWFGMSALPATATWAMLAVGGAGLALALVVVATGGGFGSGLVTHAAVMLLAGAWFFLFSRRWTDAPAIVKYAGVLTIVGAAMWSLGMAAKVVDAAELAARGAPYCIQASGPEGLRPARSKWELTGFMLRAGDRSARHANLAIGEGVSPKWLHWSYRKGAFEPDFLGGVLHCDLRAASGQALGWLDAPIAAGPDAVFWLAGGQWRIPDEYRGGGSDRPAKLHFFAQGSAFEPLARPPAGQDLRTWDVIERTVTVSLCTPEKLHVWHVTGNDVNFQLETTGHENGLERQVVKSRGAADPRIQFLGRDDLGKPTTWIQCDGQQCRHAFNREGIVIEFMHPEREFAAWRTVQDSAWRRLHSFALVWPDGPVKSCKDN
jgi:hypothetical protein